MTSTVMIIVATMSGTAEMVADEIAYRFEDADVAANIVRMEKVSAAAIAAAEWVLICSSTYGTGDVPDNGAALYAELQAKRPDLRAIRYGVVALGDSIYPQTYCFGGKKFDELFASLGATRIGERLQHDARSGIYPEDAAGEWAEEWLELTRAWQPEKLRGVAHGIVDG